MIHFHGMAVSTALNLAGLCVQTDFIYNLQASFGVRSAKRVHLSWHCNSMKPIIAVKRQRVCGLWLAWSVQ